MNESSSKSSLLRHPQQRVGVFIDTQNLYHSARSNFNSNVNYKNLVESAVSGRKLLRAFAYVIKSDTSDESKFFDALIELGIETRVKDLQIFYSGEKKADWDVGIAMDIVRLSEKIDVVVLVSGDGDFLEVFRYCKSRGIRAELMAFKKTTSAKLLEEADDFIDLGGENGRYLIPQEKPRERVSAGRIRVPMRRRVRLRHVRLRLRAGKGRLNHPDRLRRHSVRMRRHGLLRLRRNRLPVG